MRSLNTFSWLVSLTFSATGLHAGSYWDQAIDLQGDVAYAAPLYAAEPAHDPYRIITTVAAPPELSELYAALDTRLPPTRIYTYSKDVPSEEPKTSNRLVFSTGSPEDKIIQFIRNFEAGSRGYDAVWHGNKTPLPDLPTKMTVCEVRDWQIRAARNQASTAIGLFQIVGGTFRQTLQEMQLPCNTLFDARTQDRMGLHLLYGRGWADFKSGIMDVEKFAFELAGEWAAFPSPYAPNKGQSRYKGIAGNAHQIDLSAYLKFLTDLQEHIVKNGNATDPQAGPDDHMISIQIAAAMTAFNVTAFNKKDAGDSSGALDESIKIVSFSGG